MAAAPAAGQLPGPGFRVCTACLARSFRQSSKNTGLLRHRLVPRRELQTGTVSTSKASKSAVWHSRSLIQDYFSANSSIDRGWIKSGMLAVIRSVAGSSRTGQHEVLRATARAHAESNSETPPVIVEESPSASVSQGQAQLKESDSVEAVQLAEMERELPHRKRKRLKSSHASSEAPLPLDSSSQLTTAATTLPTSAVIRRRLATYLSLSIPRLSVLIILTTTSAYSLYPIPDILTLTATSATSSFSTSTLTLLFLTSGTFMSCACANALNMLAEPKYDAMMSRTRNRPLVRGLISRRAAALFAFLCGASGLLLLGFGTNPTVAGLSALNIFLYAGVYTPMKRISAANTWVGALVGAIPRKFSTKLTTV